MVRTPLPSVGRSVSRKGVTCTMDVAMFPFFSFHLFFVSLFLSFFLSFFCLFPFLFSRLSFCVRRLIKERSDPWGFWGSLVWGSLSMSHLHGAESVTSRGRICYFPTPQLLLREGVLTLKATAFIFDEKPRGWGAYFPTSFSRGGISYDRLLGCLLWVPSTTLLRLPVSVSSVALNIQK